MHRYSRKFQRHFAVEEKKEQDKGALPVKASFWYQVDKWYQTELARKTGISQSRISRMNSENLKVSEFMKICRALEIDPGKYLSRQYPPPQPES